MLTLPITHQLSSGKTPINKKELFVTFQSINLRRNPFSTNMTLSTSNKNYTQHKH